MELEVNTEVNLLGNNLTENNINILKKVAFRYAEDIVSISNGDLSSGDIERIKRVFKLDDKYSQILDDYGTYIVSSDTYYQK